MSFGRLFWGIIILCIGVVLLGINFGWWDRSIWSQISNLWPILLIILGIGIIIGKDKSV